MIWSLEVSFGGGTVGGETGFVKENGLDERDNEGKKKPEKTMKGYGRGLRIARTRRVAMDHAADKRLRKDEHGICQLDSSFTQRLFICSVAEWRIFSRLLFWRRLLLLVPVLLHHSSSRLFKPSFYPTVLLWNGDWTLLSETHNVHKYGYGLHFGQSCHVAMCKGKDLNSSRTIRFQPYTISDLRPHDFRSFKGLLRHDFVILFDYATRFPEFNSFTSHEKNMFYRLLLAVDFIFSSAYYSSKLVIQ